METGSDIEVSIIHGHKTCIYIYMYMLPIMTTLNPKPYAPRFMTPKAEVLRRALASVAKLRGYNSSGLRVYNQETSGSVGFGMQGLGSRV